MVARGGLLSSRTGPAAAERRILDAALACIARFGVTKTTLEDVASEAGCSRATVYRYFPGKPLLLAAVVAGEVERLRESLGAALAGAATLEDVVVGALMHAGHEFASHEALQFVLAYEPEAILPHLSFGAADGLLATAASLVAPHLARFLPAERAERVGEWLCRIAMSYSCNPSPGFTLTDSEAVRALVRDFVLPGLATRG